MVYGLLRALPGDRLSCHRRLADTSARLDASIGASGPHAFAVRVSAVRQERIHVHRIPLHVRDDRERPSDGAGRGELVMVICPTAKAQYFFERDWTTQISLIRLDKSGFTRKSSLAD
jgi:hypothetical protein